MMSLPLALRPRTLSPGEMVSGPGLYRSPHGGYRIRLAGPSGGFKTVTLERRRPRFWVWFEYVPYTPNLVDEEREWFLCFDKYDRLWKFKGAWDPAWGKTRLQPSGGTAVWVPSVTLEGAMYTHGRGPDRAVCVVSEVGNWEGIPPEFFSRVLERRGATWRDVPEIAPEYTEAQSAAVRRQMIGR